MGAHHVVGINLELGLGVHLGGRGAAQVAVALIGLDTRTVGLHQYLAGKGADSVVVEHIFEHLVAVATGCVVADEGVAVDVLLTAGDGHAQQMGLGMLTVDLDMVVVAGEAVDERDAVDEHIAALVLVDIDRRHAAGLGGALLHVVVVHTAALHGDNLDDLVVQVTVVGALGVITGEYPDGSVLAHDDEQTALHHHVERGIEDVDQLDGTLGDDTVGNIDEQAVLHQQAVERHGGVAHLGQLAVIGIHQFGMVNGGHAERLDDDLADVALGGGTAVERVVAAVVQAGAHVGHVAVEGLAGVGIKGQAVHVHAIVVGEDRLKVGGLIVLAALARQPRRFQLLAGIGAHRVQQSR